MKQRLRTVLGVFLWLVLAVAASSVWLGDEGETLAHGQTTFTGNSFRVDNEGVRLSRRGFDAGARSHWHAHGQDQLLFVQAGRMRYQVEGGRMQEVDLYDSTYLTSGIPHWHGAVPDQDLTQVSVTFDTDDGAPFEWLEAVSDEQYQGDSGR